MINTKAYVLAPDSHLQEHQLIDITDPYFLDKIEQFISHNPDNICPESSVYVKDTDYTGSEKMLTTYGMNITKIIARELLVRLERFNLNGKTIFYHHHEESPPLRFRRAYYLAKTVLPLRTGEYIDIYRDGICSPLATIGILATPDHVTVINHSEEPKRCHEFSIHDQDMIDKTISTIALII